MSKQDTMHPARACARLGDFYVDHLAVSSYYCGITHVCLLYVQAGLRPLEDHRPVHVHS
jgi:hypothetical protein